VVIWDDFHAYPGISISGVTVPEPGTLALLLVAAAAAGALRRRRGRA